MTHAALPTLEQLTLQTLLRSTALRRTIRCHKIATCADAAADINIAHAGKVPVSRATGFGGDDKYVSVAKSRLQIQEYTNTTYTYLLAEQQKCLKAHRAAAGE